MLLRHTTTTRKISSIMTIGLQPGMSIGKIQGVWLHDPGSTSHLQDHCSTKHGVHTDDLITLVVSVPLSWLKRFARGRWYCTRPIPVSRIVSVLPFRTTI